MPNYWEILTSMQAATLPNDGHKTCLKGENSGQFNPFEKRMVPCATS